MFIKSAASDTLQGKAIQAVNERWGEGKWIGRETIGITVCKKKYNPFHFTVEEGPDGKVVKVERLFGCRLHSCIRKEKIETHGVRPGWEPFGQWSMRKAQELAKRETERINRQSSDTEEDTVASASSEEELKTMCNNGKCTWKLREKYDNVYTEITGNNESSDEG